jgi:ribonucleoside-diphosphate reductase alpha chain
MLAMQMFAPNSPQWFNTGLHWAYGIDGPAQGHSTSTRQTAGSYEVVASESAYERPQPHACFIQSIEDDLVNEGGIMDLWVREARLFKYGSGTGTNFSNLRGKGEKLSGGGKSSGLMSFLKIGDRAAGAIKSGGTTRRAAKMVIVDVDHPDIEEPSSTGRLRKSRRSPLSWPGRSVRRRSTSPRPTRSPRHLKRAIKDARKAAFVPDSYIKRVLDLAEQGTRVRVPRVSTSIGSRKRTRPSRVRTRTTRCRSPTASSMPSSSAMDWHLKGRTNGRRS